jgi:hypothetical protein
VGVAAAPAYALGGWGGCRTSWQEHGWWSLEFNELLCVQGVFRLAGSAVHHHLIPNTHHSSDILRTNAMLLNVISSFDVCDEVGDYLRDYKYAEIYDSSQ